MLSQYLPSYAQHTLASFQLYISFPCSSHITACERDMRKLARGRAGRLLCTALSTGLVLFCTRHILHPRCIDVSVMFCWEFKLIFMEYFTCGLYMYAYMCVCLYVCMYVCKCLCEGMNACLYLCISYFMCVGKYDCMPVYLHRVCVCMHIRFIPSKGSEKVIFDVFLLSSCSVHADK